MIRKDEEAHCEHVVHHNTESAGLHRHDWLVCDCGWRYDPAPLLPSRQQRIAEAHIADACRRAS